MSDAAVAPVVAEVNDGSLPPAERECLTSLLSMGFSSADAMSGIWMHSYNVEKCMEFILMEPAKREEMTKNVHALLAMGFDKSISVTALERNSNNTQAAMDWIFSHQQPTTSTKATAATLLSNPQPIRTSTSSASSAITSTSSSMSTSTSSTTSTSTFTSTSTSTSTSTFPPSMYSSQSDSDINMNFLVHKAVWFRDIDALGAYCKRENVINQRDHHGNTPVSLAFRLGYYDLVNYLLNRGCDPRLETGRGWSILQEAALMQQKQVCMDIYLHQVLAKQQEWEARLPILTKQLDSIPDFYMEMDWKIESWVPFLSRLAPSDTFRIWKSGNRLRFDSNVRGMDNLNVQKGLMSFIFNKGSIYLVDHVGGYWIDAFAEFRNPNYDRIERTVESLLRNDVGRSDIHATNITFKPKKSLFGYAKEEKVGEWKCKQFDMEGLFFTQIKLKKSARKADTTTTSTSTSSSPDEEEEATLEELMSSDPTASPPPARAANDGNVATRATAAMTGAVKNISSAITSATTTPVFIPPPLPPFEQYFDGTAIQRYHQRRARLEMASASLEHKSSSSSPRDNDDIAMDGMESESLQVTKKEMSATVWLSEHFPMPVQDLLHILEIVSPANVSIAKLKDILSGRLPPGFPVRLVIPVFTQINAAVTFTKYVRQTDPADIFEIPKQFRER